MNETTTTTFILNNRTLASMQVPADHASLAANLLRRSTGYFCLKCGDVFARRFNTAPLHPNWDLEFKTCPSCASTSASSPYITGLFFNNYQLLPREEKTGISLIDVLPQEILSLELICRGDDTSGQTATLL